MQPASPMELSEMCEGWGAHKRSSKDPPQPNKTIKSTTIFNMCVNARNHNACRRWCAPHHHDKLRIAQTKQQKQIISKSQTKIKQAPSLISTSQTSTTQNQLPKPTSQQTPRSIQQTYCRDPDLSNEKDAPNMTTAQCNRPRRWSCLQCVRDGERTKDHEHSARHATKK